MVCFHVTKKENLKNIFKEGLLPMIGERSEGLETIPAVFLFPDENSMNTALSTWLGELFDENEELISLKINLPEDWELFSDVEYEVFSLKKIPSNFIKFYKEE